MKISDALGERDDIPLAGFLDGEHRPVAIVLVAHLGHLAESFLELLKGWRELLDRW